MRLARRALRLVAIALGGVALLAALLAWRLSYGPIGLDFLAPYLGAALSSRAAGLRVEVGGTALAWDRVPRRPDVHATNVRLIGRDGESLATFPVLRIGLSLPALLCGGIVPTRVALLGPRLRIDIRADGSLGIGLTTGSGAADGRSVGTAAAALPSELAVHASRAEILFVDQLSGETARAAGVDLDFVRAADGMTARLAGDVMLDGRVIPLRIGARWALDLMRADVTLGFRRFDLSGLGGLLSRTAAPRDARWLRDLAALLSRLRMPLDGRVTLALDDALRPAWGRVRLRGASGTLALSEVQRDELALSGFRLVARVQVPTRVLALQALTLDLGGPRLRIVGRAHGNAINLRTTVKHLSTEALARYWPPDTAFETRRWVTANLSRGQIRSGVANVRGNLSANGHPRFTPEAITGSFAFDGLTLRYQEPMPPATGVAGTGTFDGKRWNLQVARGAIGNLDLVRATVVMPGAGRDAPRAELDAVVRGPLGETLALVQRAPFHAPGIDPGSVSGAAVVHLLVRIPRAGRPPDIQASAHLSEVAILRLLRDRSVTAGDFRLELDARKLHLEGEGKLEGVPLALVWSEERDSARPRRVVDVRGRVDAPGRAALGFDLAPWLDGPVDIEAHYAGDGGQSGTLDVRADLADTVVTLPVRALSKDAGARGEARARLELRDGSVSAVHDFELRVAASRVTGQASRSADGSVWRAIEAEATLAALAPGGRPSTCRVTVEHARSGYGFRLTSDDAGALLERLAFGSSARGGRLVFEGTADLAAPAYPLDGRLDVRELTLLRAPVLARVATLASVSGVRDALAGSGIRFHQLSADIRHRDTTVTIADGLASGSSLDIAVKGTIERNTGIADLSGTLIPSYAGINTAPGRIPLVGALATGRGDTGVYAVDFAVRGPLASPNVSVDPVSALSPGALRDLERRLRR